MRLSIRLCVFALVGITAFGSVVKAAEAPANPPNPSGTPLTEALKASEKVLTAPVETLPEGVPADLSKRCPQWEDEIKPTVTAHKIGEFSKLILVGLR